MSYCAPSDPHHLTKAQARNQWGVAAAYKVSFETIQNKICTRLDANFRQDNYLIIKLLERAAQTMIFVDAFLQIVPSFWISFVNFRPGRSQKNSLLKAIVFSECFGRGYSCSMLQRHGRVHKSTVKESPSFNAFNTLPVARRHLDCFSGKCLEIYPR